MHRNSTHAHKSDSNSGRSSGSGSGSNTKQKHWTRWTRNCCKTLSIHVQFEFYMCHCFYVYFVRLTNEWCDQGGRARACARSFLHCVRVCNAKLLFSFFLFALLCVNVWNLFVLWHAYAFEWNSEKRTLFALARVCAMRAKAIDFQTRIFVENCRANNTNKTSNMRMFRKR